MELKDLCSSCLAALALAARRTQRRRSSHFPRHKSVHGQRKPQVGALHRDVRVKASAQYARSKSIDILRARKRTCARRRVVALCPGTGEWRVNETARRVQEWPLSGAREHVCPERCTLQREQRSACQHSQTLQTGSGISSDGTSTVCYRCESTPTQRCRAAAPASRPAVEHRLSPLRQSRRHHACRQC